MDVLLKAISVSSKSPIKSVKQYKDRTKIKVVVSETALEANIVINKRACGLQNSLYIYIPSSLTGSKTTTYITFKNQYGVGHEFRSFITKKLKLVVSTWYCREVVKKWCQNWRGWKKHVEESWEIHLLQQGPRKRSRSSTDDNLLVRAARLKTTISIPLRGFLPKGEVPVIRIRVKKDRRKEIQHPVMIFPKAIFGRRKKKQGLKNPFGQKPFGHDKQWSQFVKEQLTAVVETWDSVESAQKWLRECVDDFVVDVNSKWSRLKSKENAHVQNV